MSAPAPVSPPAALAAMQRLKIDDIVHPDDRAKAREFECPVCLSIPSGSSAVQSVCCSAIFCTDCLEPLGACPNCRTGFAAAKKTTVLPPIVHRILQNLKVFCPHHADTRHPDAERQAASLAGSSGSSDNQISGGGGSSSDKMRRGGAEHATGCCDWTGNFGDLLTKHVAECSYVQIDCPHGCGGRFLRGQLSTHEEGCEKGYEECGICGVMVKIGGMAGHRAEAAETHVKILEGERADLRAQASERDAVQTEVNGVKADVSAIANELKTMNRDVAELIVVNGLGPRVIWKVKTGDMFEQCKAKGDLFCSPGFHVGACKFSISFFPLGVASSQDGKAGLGIAQLQKQMFFPGYVEVVTSAIGNEFAAISVFFPWERIFDSPSSSLCYGEVNLFDIADLRKTSEIIVSLRHSNGDNGRVIELGASAETHSTSTETDRTLELFRAEMKKNHSEAQSFKEEIRKGLADVKAVQAKVEEREQLPATRSAVVQTLSARVMIVQAQMNEREQLMNEREQLHAQKAVEARTINLVSLGVTAVAVVCLAIVVGRK